MRSLSDFHIYHAKYQSLTDKSIDMFLKGGNFPKGSDERQICRLKSKIYKKEAMKYLKMADEEARKALNE